MKLSPELKQAKQIKITLVRSGIGRPKKHKLVLKGLGLRKLNNSVLRPNTPQIWGMVNKVSHLVCVGLPDKAEKVSIKSSHQAKPKAEVEAKAEVVTEPKAEVETKAEKEVKAKTEAITEPKAETTTKVEAEAKSE